jgi:hypothetical protein
MAATRNDLHHLVEVLHLFNRHRSQLLDQSLAIGIGHDERLNRASSLQFAVGVVAK